MPLEQPDAPTSLLSGETLEELIDMARRTPIEGCLVEVGVWQGGSAFRLHQLALEQGRQIFLYDTFAGMPYFTPELDSHPLGDFANTSINAIRECCPKATVIGGIFPDSAVSMPPIAFAHIDVDNYRCVYETADYLRHKMMPGGVMWFDDSPCLGSAKKATAELFGDLLQLARNDKHYVRF